MPANTLAEDMKMSKKTKAYNPEYEKDRKQRPISFSTVDVVESRLLEMIKRFKYGVYIKNILSNLTEEEVEQISKGNFDVVPSSLIKQTDQTINHSPSQSVTVSDLTDIELLEELSKRKLLPEVNESHSTNNGNSFDDVLIKRANHFNQKRHTGTISNKTLEDGSIEVQYDDGTTVIIDPEYAYQND